MKIFFKHLINIIVWLILILFFFNVLATNYFMNGMGLPRIFLDASLDYLRNEKEKKKVILLKDYFAYHMIYDDCKNESKTKLIKVYMCEGKKNEK